MAEDDGGFRSTNTVSITATNPPNIAIILPNGSTWKYLDDGSDQGVAWRGLFFGDNTWASGVAELGYGDATGNNRPERTVLSYGLDPNAKYPTTYFRKTFSVSDPSIFTNLIVRLLRDDSGIVYINDTEVFRSGLTNETVDFSTYTQPGITDDGTIYQVTNVSPSVLVAGDNIVAVEIHQDAGNSSDISFDLMLWGEPGGPPLRITRINNTRADLSWPFPSSGYVLEFTGNLTSPSSTVWTADLTDPDVPDATSHHVTVTTSSGKRFFRLHKP